MQNIKKFYHLKCVKLNINKTQHPKIAMHAQATGWLPITVSNAVEIAARMTEASASNVQMATFSIYQREHA
jgi:hypothetical protein